MSLCALLFVVWVCFIWLLDFYFQECKKMAEQIEKMKCCGNCKYVYKNCTKEKDCKQNKYKHWELAE